jgi:Na+/H+ antiporter NhaC
MSATSGIAIMAYFPFCFFNLINAAISFIYALFGVQIKHVESEIERAQHRRKSPDMVWAIDVPNLLH